jgi:Rrf2 family transcriptional regulator, nitric oxide-sensitive transcriptional repressor
MCAENLWGDHMQLTVSSDSALRTLIYLGQKKAPATIAEVAEACGVAKSSLMKVVMTLVSANLVASERGRTGGISLALDAKDISVGSVIRLMENSLALVDCMKDSPSSCPLLPKCRLKRILYEAQESFFATLDNKSLADLLVN